eukprot:scpid51422/ scgid2193/ Solute carrier family 15 member 1; Intestinal H(+)/peptide cotransporter; Oligopeptide transporter, small intestine isoform; Peptide transporter 1
MAVQLTQYHTLEEEHDEGDERETALTGDGGIGDSVSTKSFSASRGNKGSAAAFDPAEPKISGRAWGRVFKYFRQIRQYPKAICFIFGTEFCERFSYYGLKGVLILYLTAHMGYSDDRATALYHAFVVLCYASAPFGAMIADGWLGKFKTIVYLSLVHAAGNILMAGTSAPLHNTTAVMVVPLIGLLLVAIGTGGIKPCVSSFGGDQFRDDQSHLIPRYFSVFYFSINAGSLTSIVSPILRGYTTCFHDDCYLYAFGFPAILMLITIGIFIAGNRYYIKRKPTQSLIPKVVKAIVLAIRQRVSNRSGPEKKEHWLYWAESRFERQFLDDVRDALRVIFLLLPVPIFWTLFDQTGSRWTLQAKRMNGRIGGIVIEPDLMQSANSAMILLFIPLFDFIIYPVLRRCHLPMRPLQRMSSGMLLAALSFVIAAFVQIRLEAATDAHPASSVSRVRVINALPVGLNVTMMPTNAANARSTAVFDQVLAYGKATSFGDLRPGEFEVKATTVINGSQLRSTRQFSFSGASIDSVVAAYNGSHLILSQITHDLTKLGGDEFAIRILNCNPSAVYQSVYVTMHYYDKSKRKMHDEVLRRGSMSTGIGFLQQSTRNVLTPPAHAWLVDVQDSASNSSLYNGTFEFENGVLYTVLLGPSSSSDPTKVSVTRMVDADPTSIHILWQLIQYTVITAGEIMFSI